MGNSQNQSRRSSLIKVIAGAAAALVISGFAVVTTTPAETAQASPLNNTAGIGYYQPKDSSYHLSYETPPSGGGSDRAFNFGPANSGGIVPVSGDWDGNGGVSVGWYRYSDASWHLTQELNDGSDITFNWGPAGNTSVVPVVGDWNGDGKDTVGWYRPSDASWHLASSNASNATSTTFLWGPAGDATVTGIAGDWNGDGTDTVGWYRPKDASWHLADANAGNATSNAFAWGDAGNTSVKPVVGDWNGNKTDTIGWYRPSDGSFHVSNGNIPSAASINFLFGPAGDTSIVPVAGDWDGRSAPSSSIQTVAKRLQAQYNAGRIHFDGNKTQIYEREILPYAQSGVVADGCDVDIRILQVLAMAVDKFGSITVSDIGRPCIDEKINCDFSLHCYDPARAIDVTYVGASWVKESPSARVNYLQFLDSVVPSGSQAGQFNCASMPAFSSIRSVKDVDCSHQHFDLGGTTAAVRYTP